MLKVEKSNSKIDFLQGKLGGSLSCERKQWKLEWADVIRDLNNLVEMEVAMSGRGCVFRGQSPGIAGKVFQACGVALPPTLRAS